MSFWELVVVGIVALIVLGPEKLPGAIRTVTGTIRSIREFGQQMKSELSDELRVHELHEKLRDAEAKGLLGLTPEEQTALAQLRNAAAEVTNPYASTPATAPTQMSSDTPSLVPAAPEAPSPNATASDPTEIASSTEHPTGHHEQKTSS